MAPRTLVVAQPRGFCAGVAYAIEIVERVLEHHGAPLYVRHEIVHNRHVVDGLRRRGAIFVDQIDAVPPGARVVFSAHGVSPTVHAAARERSLHAIDATCPLVTKVHLQVLKHAREGCEILLIGHRGHVEVEGTLGHAPDRTHVVESVAEAEALRVVDPERLAIVTQTTLSVDDTRDIIATLRRRFPAIRTPATEDICYATQNRQSAVRELARECDAVLVLGSSTSSNANRLVDVARQQGRKAQLLDAIVELDPTWLQDVDCLGLTAGASTPEVVVQDAIAHLAGQGFTAVRMLDAIEENVSFPLPRELRESPALAAPGAGGRPDSWPT